jgi:LysM repeat protein
VNGISPRARAAPATLVVPAGGAPQGGRLPIMYAPPIPAPEPRTVTHTVKAGETLASIASRYRVSMEDLRTWNRIGRLAPGQKLVVKTRAVAPSKSKKRPVAGKPRLAVKKKVVKKSRS